MSELEILQRLFVYGTLMSGECRHGVLQRLGPLQMSAAWVAGRLVNLGSYPGLLPAARDGDVVLGELYEFDLEREEWRRALTELDDIEGYLGSNDPGNLYDRQVTEVFVDGVGAVEAWVYWYVGPMSSAIRIEGNSWRNVRLAP